MKQKRIAIPPPHEEREWVASTLTPAFNARMRRHGFTTLRTRSIYTDPDVFRQQWVMCPMEPPILTTPSFGCLAPPHFVNSCATCCHTRPVHENHLSNCAQMAPCSPPTCHFCSIRDGFIAMGIAGTTRDPIKGISPTSAERSSGTSPNGFA